MFIKKFKYWVNENKFVDNALDKINSLGGFKNLPDIDKLALLTDTNNDEQLKKLDLSKIYKENGGTFGRLLIEVRVKDLKEQLVEHTFSKEFANKTGWLYPYINYTEDNKEYISVRFDEFNIDSNIKGGGFYEERPIMLDNLYPIGYKDIKSEFVDYDKKVDYERKEFLSMLGMDDLEDDDIS